jgi:hypothetical protein
MSGHLKIVRRPKSPFWYIRGTVQHIRVEESTGIVDDGSGQQKDRGGPEAATSETSAIAAPK